MVFMGPTSGLLNPTVAVASMAVGAVLMWALAAKRPAVASGPSVGVSADQTKRAVGLLAIVFAAALMASDQRPVVQTQLVGFFCDVCDQGGWLCLITWCWLF